MNSDLNLTKYKALSFDCYGTLIDWETGIADVLVPWAREQGLDLSDEELLLAYAGNEAAVERESPSALYPDVLAKAFRLRGDPDRAIDAYTRAARVAGENFSIRKEFGLYLLDPLAQNQEAEYWLRMANRLQPFDEQVNAALAKLGVTITASSRSREPIPHFSTTARQPSNVSAAQPPVAGSAVDLPRD